LVTIRESSTLVSPAALALMLTVVILSLFDAGFDNNAVHTVVIMLTGVAIFLSVKGKLPLCFNLKHPLLWYSLFFFWAGVTIFWSVNPHRTMVEFIQIASYGFVFILASSLNTDNIFRVGRIALTTGFGVALFGLSYYLIISTSRIQSTLVNANVFGIYMVMLFLIGWGYYLRKPNLYLGTVCVTMLVALILSSSRGSFISLGLVLPLLIIGLHRNEIRQSIIKTAFCVGAALIITQGVMFIAPYLQEMVGEDTAIAQILTSRSSFVSSSGAYRLGLWDNSLRIFFSQPFSGTGLGTYFLAYFTEYIDSRYYSRFVHNHYLQIMSELGMIGVLFLTGFIATLIRAVWLRLKQGSYPYFLPGIIAASTAFLIHIGVDFSWNFPGSAIIFFLMSGVIVSLSWDNVKTEKKFLKPGLIIVSLVIMSLTIWQLSANLLYNQAIEKEMQGDLYAASEIYDLANSIYPINSSAYTFASNNYYRIAHEQSDLELLKKSLERSKRALAFSPIDANLHNQLGRLYLELDQIDKAEHHFQEAVKYAGFRLGMFIYLASLYIQQERYEEAEVILRESLEVKEAARSRLTDRDLTEENIETIYKLLNQL